MHKDAFALHVNSVVNFEMSKTNEALEFILRVLRVILISRVIKK